MTRYLFQDAHLQPEFQLSGGDRYSGGAGASSAVLGGMVAPPPSSFGAMRSDRDAIFGGPMSPQRNPVAGPSYRIDTGDSDEKKLMDGSEEFIEIKVRCHICFALSDVPFYGFVVHIVRPLYFFVVKRITRITAFVAS